MAVELAPELLEILACPNCHGALTDDMNGRSWSAWRPIVAWPTRYESRSLCC